MSVVLYLALNAFSATETHQQTLINSLYKWTIQQHIMKQNAVLMTVLSGQCESFISKILWNKHLLKMG